MKTFEYKNQIHHLISLGNDVYVSYENIMKNFKKPDPWGTFVIKKFTKDGEPLVDYISVGRDIFRNEFVKPFTRKFNPEYLI